MNSVQIDRYNRILFYVRSFEGVTNDNCPSLESLRDGYIFTTIYNQMTNSANMLDTSLLKSRCKTCDWLHCAFNLSKLYIHVKPEFELLGIYYPINLTKIAKNGDLEQICAFIKMLLRYSLKCPKKEEFEQKFRSLPTLNQVAVLLGIKINQS